MNEVKENENEMKTRKGNEREKQMLESVIEKYLARKISLIGGKCIKFISPSLRGVPDRIILLPKGRSIFVELKKPDGKLRVQQQKRIEDLRQLGFPCFVVYTKEQADRLVQCLAIGQENINGLRS